MENYDKNLNNTMNEPVEAGAAAPEPEINETDVSAADNEHAIHSEIAAMNTNEPTLSVEDKKAKRGFIIFMIFFAVVIISLVIVNIFIFTGGKFKTGREKLRRYR